MMIPIAAVALVAGLGIAAEPQQVDHATKMQELKERAKKNDYKALLELGQQGDRSVIPMLREFKQREERHFGGASASAQMALAKLGETKEFAEILAELKDEDPGTQDRAIEKLAYIGGPKAIKALGRLLGEHQTRRPKWNIPPAGTQVKGKVFFAPLGWMAAKALSQIVEHPPTPPKELPSKDDMVKWREWWQANKAKYEKE